MKLHILTIVLDGMPFIPYHLPMLELSNTDWHWHIVHGSAMNRGSTAWCNQQEPRLSMDGTTEYLQLIKSHPRVSIYEKAGWNSKDEMANEPLKHINEKCVLMEIDADEMWESWMLGKIVNLFKMNPSGAVMEFKCRYFVGVNIVTTNNEGYGSNPGEWRRAWRFTPGDNFARHEPPNLRQSNPGETFDKKFLTDCNLVFNHYAYLFEHQVAYKEQFYGYFGAVENWRRLQANTVWPVKDLREFLPWVGPGASADKLSS